MKNAVFYEQKVKKERLVNRRKFAVENANYKQDRKPLVQILREQEGKIPAYLLEQPEVVRVVKQEFERVTKEI